MSIAELGSIGEFIASIGVLITLIVLVLESRRNTKLMIRSNSRQTYIHNGQALALILDKDNTGPYFRAHNEGMGVLNPLERYRFDLTFVPWLQCCEQAFADARDGIFPEDQIQVFEAAVCAWLTTPGGAEWWRERDVWFGQNFRNDVNRLIKEQHQETAKAGPIPVAQ